MIRIMIGIILIKDIISLPLSDINNSQSLKIDENPQKNYNYSYIFNLEFNKFTKLNSRLLHSSHSSHSSHSTSTHSVSHSTSHYSSTHTISHSGIIISNNILISLVLTDLIKINSYPYYDNILEISNETHKCKFIFDYRGYNSSEFKKYLDNNNYQDDILNHIKNYCYEKQDLSNSFIIFVLMIIIIFCCCIFGCCKNNNSKNLY